jgi:hypothetical protein
MGLGGQGHALATLSPLKRPDTHCIVLNNQRENANNDNHQKRLAMISRKILAPITMTYYTSYFTLVTKHILLNIRVCDCSNYTNICTNYFFITYTRLHVSTFLGHHQGAIGEYM